MSEPRNLPQLQVPSPESLNVPVLPFDVAASIVENNYTKGGNGTFISQVQKVMVNPYELSTAKGLLRIHPVVLTIAIVVIAAAGVFVYFSFAA